MNPINEAAERKAFEKWARPWYILDRNADGLYSVAGAYIAWNAWWAAATQRADPAPSVQAAAKVIEGGQIRFLANGKDNPKVGTLLYTATPASADSAADARDAWISVGDRLPSCVPLANGDTPIVLVHWKEGELADNLSQISTSNTVYLCRHTWKFTHWMALPAPPIAATTGKDA